MIERFVPPHTSRRLALQLTRHALVSPGTLPRRVNRHNLRLWREARAWRATCNICGHHGRLLDEMLDIEGYARDHIPPARETLRCRGCGSTMRDRLMAAALLDHFFSWAIIAPTIDALAAILPKHIRILDTDPHSRIAEHLGHLPGYYRSVSVPGMANGETLGEDRLINVDLQDLPFPDRTFHVILTSEVMERVDDVDRAHREIARCLRPIGECLFTSPCDPDMDSDGIRSYRIFGRDIVGDLAAAGLTARFSPVDRPDIGVFRGELFRAVPASLPAAS